MKCSLAVVLLLVVVAPSLAQSTPSVIDFASCAPSTGICYWGFGSFHWEIIEKKEGYCLFDVQGEIEDPNWKPRPAKPTWAVPLKGNAVIQCDDGKFRLFKDGAELHPIKYDNSPRTNPSPNETPLPAASLSVGNLS